MIANLSEDLLFGKIPRIKWDVPRRWLLVSIWSVSVVHFKSNLASFCTLVIRQTVNHPTPPLLVEF